MIESVTNADSIPVLERLMDFAASRHKLIAGNIANLSTPDYRPVDLSVSEFQAELAEAVDERRERSGNQGGELRFAPATERAAEPAGYSLLYHDRNDRDVEQTMQDLVENFMTFRLAAQFMRSRFDLINTAIRERI
ncbi:MAG: flagellar basal body rod protein FlgB [Planctomycetota bacterium]|jgi:flagellar basal-body rod protein FlgB